MSSKPRQIRARALLVMCMSLSVPFAVGQKPYTTWKDYLGSSDSAQYSALEQINKSNVKRLELMWFYPAGNNGAEFGFNPIVVDGLMYVLGKNSAIVALEAATGKEVWVHQVNSTLIAHRGINYWESKDRSDRRLLLLADNYLQALDARTGKEITSFGDNGRVDLRLGLGRDPKTITLIQSFSPGRVFENLVILGSATGEEYDSPPGDLRAYDVLTGKMVWIFHTVPHPGERGYDTWPKEAWRRIGGVNTWGEISIDEKRGIAYFPLGAPTYDFYGGDRKGANLFADCLLALDARTGKYLWHFQFVHHDLWDYDPAAAPKLISVRHEGKMVDAVAEPTKHGFLFVYDRVTGKPLWPIEERSVPKSDVPGEEAWPTQPFPTAPPPFARQKFTADEINPYIADAAERAKWRDTVLSARNEGLFTPPGFRNTIEMPGNSGGANWGASAIDPGSGMIYVESKDSPTMLKLEGKPPKVDLDAFGSPERQGRVVYVQHCQMCHGPERNGSPPAVPSLVNVVTRLGTDRIRSILRVGAPPMPSFSSLSTKEVDVLIAFLSHPEAGDVSKEMLAWLGRAPRLDTSAALGSSPVRYWSGYGYMNSTEGLPAINPPWSTLTAYDLNAGTIKWQIPLGEVTELAAKGIKNTGSNWPRGGPVVTAGGLIFVGTRSDRKIRAYDKDTGTVLWEKELPARVDGVPSVFELGGREYVAVCGRDVERTTPDTEIVSSPPGKPPVQGYYLFALSDENRPPAGSQ
jgi:quinoprotein glucose dehydrogenase